MPVRNLEAFAAHCEGITGVFESFRMLPEAIFEDEGENAVVVHVRMVGRLRGMGEGDGVWQNEGVVMMWMDGKGKKVVRMREFVDSTKAREMMEKVKPDGFAD